MEKKNWGDTSNDEDDDEEEEDYYSSSSLLLTKKNNRLGCKKNHIMLWSENLCQLSEYKHENNGFIQQAK